MKETKTGRIHLRINENLKKRYEAALAGRSLGPHLTNLIYEFVVNEEKRIKKLEEAKIDPVAR